jgi:hypothetical protein
MAWTAAHGTNDLAATGEVQIINRICITPVGDGQLDRNAPFLHAKEAEPRGEAKYPR